MDFKSNLRAPLFSSVLCLILLMGFADQEQQTDAADTDWFTERQTTSHSASLNKDPPAFPLTLMWKVNLPAAVHSSPVIHLGQGNLYIGSDDNNLWALDPFSGAVRWNFETGGDIYSSAAAITETDGTGNTVEKLFITSRDGNLYSIDPFSGQEIWRDQPGIGPFISSANYADGKVFYLYQTVVSSFLRAVDSTTGNLLWESDGFNVSTAPPAVARGNLYLGIRQGGRNFHAIDLATGDTRKELLSGGLANNTALTSGVPNLDWPVTDQGCNIIGDRIYVSTRSGIVSALQIHDGASQAVYD